MGYMQEVLQESLWVICRNMLLDLKAPLRTTE
jgi:hypothetical protein